MEAISRTLGGNIAALRKARGITQEQLAARVGVSAPAVSKWETGSSCSDIALLCPWPGRWTPTWTPCCNLNRPFPTKKSPPG